MPKWTGIIIHHSATKDNKIVRDWEGIRRYHMSYRLHDEIMTMDQVREYVKARKALALKKKNPTSRWKWAGVVVPWRDIGYHWGIELVRKLLVVQRGRPMTSSGAHCIGKNSESIGICCVGNFDTNQPGEALYFNCAQLCASIIKKYPSIKIENIKPHREYSPKTCPGIFFDMERLRDHVRTMI